MMTTCICYIPSIHSSIFLGFWICDITRGAPPIIWKDPISMPAESKYASGNVKKKKSQKKVTKTISKITAEQQIQRRILEQE